MELTGFGVFDFFEKLINLKIGSISGDNHFVG